MYLHGDGRWLGPYAPLSARHYPFALGRMENGERVLSLATSHLTLEGGTPLFDEAGALSEAAKAHFQRLQDFSNQQAITQKACEQLDRQGVLTPWEDKDASNRTNLYRIDEQALNALSSEAYYALRGAPMALAYGQLFSMNQLEVLKRRASWSGKIANTDVPENLDTVFGEDDDELRFDFDG